MDSQELAKKVDAVLCTKYEKLKALSWDDYFVDHNALDSLDVIEMVVVIEEAMGIEIPDADATEENLGSKRAIHEYLLRRLG
jgi:acyl carrier protein